MVIGQFECHSSILGQAWLPIPCPKAYAIRDMHDGAPPQLLLLNVCSSKEQDKTEKVRMSAPGWLAENKAG